MASLFTKIINSEIPGRFVWKDAHCVAFLTIAPIRPGHTLVVPRQEIDAWTDAPAELTAHLFQAAQKVAAGIAAAFPCRKVGLMIAGLEVPHYHIHLTPIDEIADMSFERQNSAALPEDLDAAAERIRTALQALGYCEAQA